jgi:glycerate-2-kinase
MSRIINRETLSDHGHVAGRRAMLEILETGLRAADPYYATLKALHLDGDILTVGYALYEPPGTPLPGPEVIDLRTIQRIFVFGAGKGINRAAQAIEEVLGDRLTGGHVIDKHGTPHNLKRIGLTYGAHPIPDAGCAEGCRRILEMAQDLRPDDLVLTVVGNGIGSLLTLPAPGLTIEDLRQVVYAFQIEKGGPTVDLVPIRNHLDAIKGGKFTRYMRPARTVHLIAFYRPPSYADMLRHPLFRWLHSLPDETTYADAITSLKRYDLWEEVPDSVRQHLQRADPAQETLKVADFEALRQRVFFIFPPELGMVPTAKRKAEEMGFAAHVLFNNYSMKPEANQLGRIVANMALHTEIDGEPFRPPCALISTGEALVTVGKETGMGGRNQEYVVAAALEIANTHHVIMGSVDSDGTDGPGHQFVDAEKYAHIPVLTGGIVDNSTQMRARDMGIDLADALKRHDTSPALYTLGDAVVAIPGMSMGDLCVTLILEPASKSERQS